MSIPRLLEAVTAEGMYVLYADGSVASGTSAVQGSKRTKNRNRRKRARDNRCKRIGSSASTAAQRNCREGNKMARFCFFVLKAVDGLEKGVQSKGIFTIIDL